MVEEGDFQDFEEGPDQHGITAILGNATNDIIRTVTDKGDEPQKVKKLRDQRKKKIFTGNQ